MFQASIGPKYQLNSVYTGEESVPRRRRIMLDLEIQSMLMRMGSSLLSKYVSSLRVRRVQGSGTRGTVQQAEWRGHTVERTVEDCETQHEEAGS
jgi:hypothetical protein